MVITKADTTNEPTGHLTPLLLFACMFTCKLFPRWEDVKFDPLLGVIPERWRGNHQQARGWRPCGLQ